MRLARPGARWPRAGLALLLFTALSVLLFWSAWSGPSGTTAGVPGDAQAELWYLEWVRVAVGHLQNPLITDRLGYPAGLNLMWNNANAVPLLGVLLAPVTALAGPATAVNISASAAPALSAFAAYLALRRYAGGHLPPVLGGLLYGFSPYMLAQAQGHFGLMFAVMPPLMLLALDQLFRGRRPVRVGAALGVLAALQLLIAEELLATEAIAAAVGLACLALFRWREGPRVARTAALGIAVAIGCFVLIAAAPLAIQFFGPNSVDGQIRGPDVYVTDVLNFMLPTDVQALHNDWTSAITSEFTGNLSEWNGYIGLPLPALLAWAVLAQWRELLVRVSAAAAVTMALLSLGPHLHVGGQVTGVRLAWRVQGVPLLSQVLPSRLMLYFFLFAAVLVTRFLDGVPDPRRSWRRDGPRVALLAVAATSLLPGLPLPATANDVPPFFTTGQVRQIPDGGLAVVAPFSRYSSEAMVWQAAAHLRFRMLGGNFIGPDGPGFQGPAPRPVTDAMEAIESGRPPPTIDPVLRRVLTDDLTGLDVRAVVIGPMDHRAEMLVFFRDLYRRAPLETGGVYLWWGVPPG